MNSSKKEKKPEPPKKVTIQEKYAKYNLDDYINDVECLGLEETWTQICKYILEFDNNNEFLDIKNFGELYEIGLALQDKNKKKKSGQYYTPDDVALVMSKWLDNCDGYNICDVACGTGKLILTYLDYIGYDKAKKIIKEGRLFLYDLDGIALKICKTILLSKYGIELEKQIHDKYGDFLSNKISLPENCKTISNPPYSAISEYSDEWEYTDVIKDTHELYSAFMEKIFSQSESTVIITPYSFISGSKFYTLRKKMCEIGEGFIVSFDNVPGNIFCGRKHGIFNTNTANSVRAAITVLNSSEKKGFKVSPMIRFKNEERNRLLKCSVLEKTIDKEIQAVDSNNKVFKKVAKPLKSVFDLWESKSSYTVKDLITKEETKFLIDMPNTCRYNTTASSKKLKRGGSITINVDSEEKYYFLYCFINSSFTYWWWRIFDGGITYPSSLLYKMPLPYNLLTDESNKKFKKIALEMIEKEKEFISVKVNAGAEQENIKFPKKYRDEINKIILELLGSSVDNDEFLFIHSNTFFYKNEEESE